MICSSAWPMCRRSRTDSCKCSPSKSSKVRSSASRPTKSRRATNWRRSMTAQRMRRRRPNRDGVSLTVDMRSRHTGCAGFRTGVFGRGDPETRDHQGSRKSAGRRQYRSAEERRCRQDHGKLQALSRFERGRCRAACRGAAPARRLESGKLGIRAHRARTRDQRRPARNRSHSFVHRIAEGISEIRAQRLGAVPAGARLRTECATRQGRLPPWTAGGAISQQPLHRRGAVSPRRDSVHRQGVPEGAGRLRGGDQSRFLVRVLQPEPLQAWLVVVQARRERAQPGFLCRRSRFRAGRQK